MDRTPDKYRVQLDFNPGAFRELEDLKTEVGAVSRADTVRYAMRVLRWMLDELKAGTTIMVSRNGNLAEVEFPFLPKFARQEDKKPAETLTDQELAESQAREAAVDLLRQKAKRYRETHARWP
jgi:hypothetical protein